MKSWPVFVLVALLVLLGAVSLLFWQISQDTPDVALEPEQATAGSSAAAQAPAPTTAPPAPADATTFAADPAIDAASMDGAERIGNILADDSLENPAVVRRLLALLPQLEEEDAIEAAQHAVNLTDDENISLWLRDVVADRFPQPVAEVFFGDLLNRPQEVLFPALAQMADNSQHSLQNDSQEILEVLFMERPENLTWTQWIARQLAEEDN